MTQLLGKIGHSTSDPSQTGGVAPFPAFPCVSRYVPTGSVDEALVRIGRGIDASEAITLVMGPPGTGKSLICQILTHRFRSSHDVVVLGNGAIKDGDSLLRHILHCLGEDVVADTNRDLYLALVDRVCGDQASEAGLLILVDEAQSIPDSVFEAIRLTTNIMKQGKPRVSVVLCGGPKLEEALASPSMEPLTQRVATRCYLHPHTLDETRQYITSVISQCNSDPDRTITLEAVSAVHHACSGVPRLINQLMTQAIDVAAEAQQFMIDEGIINKAWAMLQQLPGPMVDEPEMHSPAATPESSIEFGELSDESSDWSQPVTSDSDHGGPESGHPSVDDITVTTPSAVWVDEDALSGDRCGVDNGEATGQVTSDAIAQIASQALPAATLFGDFEFEEEVNLGGGTRGTQPQSSQAASGTATDEPVQWETANSEPVEGLSAESAPAKIVSSAKQPDQPAATSLESMLHQEIVGVSTVDTSVEVYADCCETSLFGSNEDNPIASGINHEAISQANEEVDVNTQHDESQIDFSENAEACSRTDVETTNCIGEYDIVVTCAEATDVIQEADLDADQDDDAFQIRLLRDDSDLLIIEDELELHDGPKASKSDQEDRADSRSVTVDYQALMSRMRTGT